MIFFRPHPPFLGNVMSTYFGDVLLFLLIAASFIYRKTISNLEAFALLGAFLIAFSSFLVITFSGSYNLLPEVVKIVFYGFSVAFVVNCRLFESISSELALSVIVLGLFLVALVQYYNVPWFGEVVRLIWGEAKLRSAESTDPRVYSSLFNANWFGVVVAGLALLIIDHFFITKRILLSSILFSACMLMIMLSGSRTALIAFLVSFAFIVIVRMRSLGNLALILCMLVLVLVVGVYINKSYEVSNRFLDASESLAQNDVSDIRSLGDRFSSWEKGLEIIKINPMLGDGSLLDGFVVHNSYIYVFAGFGIPLGCAMLLLMFFIFFVASKSYTSNASKGVVFISALPLAIASFAGEFLVSTQVFLSYLVIVCLSSNISRDRHRPELN